MNKDQVFFRPSCFDPSLFEHKTGCDCFDSAHTHMPHLKPVVSAFSSTPLIHYNRAMNAFCKQNRILINYQKLSSLRSHVNKTQNLLQKYLELAYEQIKSSKKPTHNQSNHFKTQNHGNTRELLNPWCMQNACEKVNFSSSLSSSASSIDSYSSSFTSLNCYSSSSCTSSSLSMKPPSPPVNKKPVLNHPFGVRTTHFEQQLRKYEELIDSQSQLINLLAQCEKETDLISASSTSDRSDKKRVRFLERAERRLEQKQNDDEWLRERVSAYKQSLSRIDFSKSMIEIIIDSYRIFLQIDQVLLPLSRSALLSLFFFLSTRCVLNRQISLELCESKPNFTYATIPIH